MNMPTQFSILKANVSEALMLVQVWGFNMQNLKEELEFVFSDRDLEQFRVALNYRYYTFEICFRLDHIGLKE